MRCSPAALPHSVTRTARRRPPFPRSSGAAEVVDPRESPTARRCGVVQKTIWPGLRQAHDQEVEQREEGDGDDTSVYEGGSSHPLFIGGGRQPKGVVRPSMVLP